MTPQQFEKLKEQIKAREEAIARAEGGIEQIMKRLKEEFDCDSLEEAEEIVSRLDEELEEDEAKLNKEIKQFEQKWSRQLSKDD